MLYNISLQKSYPHSINSYSDFLRSMSTKRVTFSWILSACLFLNPGWKRSQYQEHFSHIDWSRVKRPRKAIGRWKSEERSSWELSSLTSWIPMAFNVAAPQVNRWGNMQMAKRNRSMEQIVWSITTKHIGTIASNVIFLQI